LRAGLPVQLKGDTMSTFHAYERGETKFVMPLSVSNSVQITIEHLLVNSDTGGFTVTKGVGRWREDREDVLIYTVAGLAFSTLWLIADMMLADGQTDIYCVLPNGQASWFDNNNSGPANLHQRDIEAERKRERLSDIYNK
jgi:hypothetical protein